MQEKQIAQIKSEARREAAGKQFKRYIERLKDLHGQGADLKEHWKEF